jgi:hypothetical protein
MKQGIRYAIILIGIVALMSGCASATKQPVNIYPDPEPGKGLVYFYRGSKMYGCLVSFKITEDATIVGRIKNKTYFFIQATPGEHTYTVSGGSGSSCTIMVEPGKTYYIKCTALLSGTVLDNVLVGEARPVLPLLQNVTK